jgi:hypothetical protein
MDAAADVLRRLDSTDRDVVRAALREAESMPHELTEPLLEAMSQIHTRSQTNVPSFAMYLLARFREPRALDIILETIRGLSDDALDAAFGDTITEDVPAILASVAHGRLAPLMELAADFGENDYVQGVALDALTDCTLHDRTLFDEVDAFLESLAEQIADDPDPLWPYLVEAVEHLDFPRLRKRVEQAFAQGVVDENSYDFASFRQVPRGSRAVEAFRADSHSHLIDDVVAATRWWSFFSEPPHRAPREPLGTEIYRDVRTTPKVGRNDPCPCGSGKKFKKCCGS